MLNPFTVALFYIRLACFVEGWLEVAIIWKMTLKYSNRNIQSVKDVDKLISDIAEVLKQTIQAKEDYINGNYTIGAAIKHEDEVECIIPSF